MQLGWAVDEIGGSCFEVGRGMRNCCDEWVRQGKVWRAGECMLVSLRAQGCVSCRLVLAGWGCKAVDMYR